MTEECSFALGTRTTFARCKECSGKSVTQILYFASYLGIGGVTLLGLLTGIAKEKVDQFRKRGT